METYHALTHRYKKKPWMATWRQNSASLVVGLIFITEMIDNWQAVKSIMSATKTRGHRASAHACPQTIKWLKTYYAPSRSGGKNPFNSILNMGPCFKYLPKGYCYMLMLSVLYKMQPFNCMVNRNRHIGIFFWLKFSELQRSAK